MEVFLKKKKIRNASFGLFRKCRKSRELMDSKLEIFIGIMTRGIKYKDGLQIVERQICM